MAGGSLGGNGSCRGKIISEINVTPLVDIMLVLLIIFMVTTTYIVRDSIEVKLPEASTGEPQQVTLLALVINQQGQIFLQGQPATDEEIRRFIRQQRRKGSSMEAIVAADKNVNYGLVVRAIDLLRSEGVVKFAINVKKEGT